MFGWGIALNVRNFDMARIFETGRELSDSVKGAIGFCQNLLLKIASTKPSTSNLTEL